MNNKVRNILEDPYGEDLCLNDVIKEFVGLSETFSKLEHYSTDHHYREASKKLTKAKKMFLDFEHRIRNEVRTSVYKDISRYDKRVDPKNPDAILSFLDDI